MNIDLSPTQILVIRHIVAGRKVPNIAEAMGVSRRTVESHVSAIRDRMSHTCKDLTYTPVNMVKWAINQNYITVDEFLRYEN